METLRTEQLSKRFEGAFRLGPLDLRVAPGEILGIMGPNGAGKTTLLRLLWGFMRPDEGTISVFGMQPHLEQVKVRLRAGYLSNSPHFYSSFTARQFLRFVGQFYQGWEESRTDRLLENFEIDADLKLVNLSHGDRMKVALISAMGHRPSLLILDEPTSTIDAPVRADILHLLKMLARRENTSILLSSHISDDLDHVADSVLMLNHGHVVEYARLKDANYAIARPSLA